MIFFKNMPLTFLRNIRLFNKKNHIVSPVLHAHGRGHPKSRSLPKERSHRPRTHAHGEGFGEGFDKDERL